MGRVVDETGNRYGRLTVVRRDPENAYHKGANWICRCECGGERVASGIALRQGMAKSCGCIAREKRVLRCACGYKGQKTRDWMPDWKCYRCSGLSPLAEPPKLTEDEIFEKRVQHWRYYHHSGPTSASHDVMLFLERLKKVTKERDMAIEQHRHSQHEVAHWVDRETKAARERDEARERNTDLRTMLEQVTRDRDHVEESLVRLETQRDEARSALAACPDCAMWAERSARWHDDMQRAERERDEWRDKFLALNQTAGELCNACGWAFKIPGESCRCEVVKERDEARATIEQIRRVFGNALAFDDARGDVVKMAETAYQGAYEGDKAIGQLRDMTRQRDEARADAERYLADLRRCASEPYEHAKERAEAYRRGAEAMREACTDWVENWENDGVRIGAALRDLPIPEEP